MIMLRFFKICNNSFSHNYNLVCTTSLVWVKVQEDVHARTIKDFLIY
jgi:hypothetical protein